MSLLEEMKVLLRVNADVYDAEVQMLIDAALADMRRVGIDESLLDEDDIDPQVKMAVACYCKSNFGFDNADFANFGESYRTKVIDLLNSSANIAAREDGDV